MLSDSASYFHVDPGLVTLTEWAPGCTVKDSLLGTLPPPPPPTINQRCINLGSQKSLLAEIPECVMHLPTRSTRYAPNTFGLLDCKKAQLAGIELLNTRFGNNWVSFV